MSVVTTHVLDSVTGLPARGVAVRLDGRGVTAEARTDDDGRVRELGRRDWTAASTGSSSRPGTGSRRRVASRSTPRSSSRSPWRTRTGTSTCRCCCRPYAYSTYRGS